MSFVSITLRLLKNSDCFALFSIFSNPKVTMEAGFKPLKTQQQVDETLQHLIHDQDQESLGIDLDGQLVGVIGCDFLEKGCGMLSYMVDQKHWGHGYATKAISQYLDQLKKAGFHTVYADCFLDNYASHRVLEKNQFTYIQNFERAYIDFDEMMMCRLYIKKLS